MSAQRLYRHSVDRIEPEGMYRGTVLLLAQGGLLFVIRQWRSVGRGVESRAKAPVLQATAQMSESTSACSRTVRVAFSCLSGGYPYFRRIRFT